MDLSGEMWIWEISVGCIALYWTTVWYFGQTTGYRQGGICSCRVVSAYTSGRNLKKGLIRAHMTLVRPTVPEVVLCLRDLRIIFTLCRSYIFEFWSMTLPMPIQIIQQYLKENMRFEDSAATQLTGNFAWTLMIHRRMVWSGCRMGVEQCQQNLIWYTRCRKFQIRSMTYAEV